MIFFSVYVFVEYSIKRNLAAQLGQDIQWCKEITVKNSSCSSCYGNVRFWHSLSKQTGDLFKMDTVKISLGVKFWFFFFFFPVLHHILLHWPIAMQDTSNVVRRSNSLFKFLPWIDWVYLIAMTIVGLILILSGIKTKE